MHKYRKKEFPSYHNSFVLRHNKWQLARVVFPQHPKGIDNFLQNRAHAQCVMQCADRVQTSFGSHLPRDTCNYRASLSFRRAETIEFVVVGEVPAGRANVFDNNKGIWIQIKKDVCGKSESFRYNFY